MPVFPVVGITKLLREIGYVMVYSIYYKEAVLCIYVHTLYMVVVVVYPIVLLVEYN